MNSALCNCGLLSARIPVGLRTTDTFSYVYRLCSQPLTATHADADAPYTHTHSHTYLIKSKSAVQKPLHLPSIVTDQSPQSSILSPVRNVPFPDPAPRLAPLSPPPPLLVKDISPSPSLCFFLLLFFSFRTTLPQTLLLPGLSASVDLAALSVVLLS